ncbi:ATP-binding cassette sub-family A member 13-like [Bombina bombina]|uniref:ATP-binding cassette sub-family A member 13-like n=1 Tax=Bombina bombina TaxID=8345 RepID=UPI00235ADFB2|nr:ATP-binding cassette sub-family A member 13-like [Bombina bombina]
MYLISRFFSSSDVAFVSYFSINVIFGLCTLLITFVPQLLAIISKAENLMKINNTLKHIFLVFPPFCLGHGLIELAYNQVKFDIANILGIDAYINPFQMSFLGLIFLALGVQGNVYFLLRLTLHQNLFKGKRTVFSDLTASGMRDQDVEMEKNRVLEKKIDDDILLLYNLRKCYHPFKKKTFAAVEDICLGIQKGECFGLLGVNGAGKSTTFKMLTGEIKPTSGQAMARNNAGFEVDILSASSEGIIIGYCPQKDALNNLLTGWEHLFFYCSLRGIPEQDIYKVSGDLSRRLLLDSDINKLVGTYSGGTKRKLSTAIALIGKPHILLLDEPSTGMDPCSKRCLWNTITKEVQGGCAAVLTSHSMEECEVLCTRLAIMDNGIIKCLGSPQHIKNRFGDGFSIKVWLKQESAGKTAVSKFLKKHFPRIHLKEQWLGYLEYHLPQQEGVLTKLFNVFETNKMLLQIENYSISQISLEQVFINFATQQEIKCCNLLKSAVDGFTQPLSI